MTDKNLDNLNDPAEKAHIEAGQPAPDFSVGKESEKTPTEKSAEKKSTLEKYAKKLIPTKIKRTVRPIPQVQDEISVKIEKILETGLADEFAKLSPIARQEFKIKGEETTAKIRELLRSTHIKVKKIFYLIVEWLKILPGINNFFLEQEAKIKTDLIVGLHKKQKDDKANKLL